MELIFSEYENDVYNFEKFELCLSKQEHYISSSKGYFPFTSLHDFVAVKNGFKIVNEDNVFEIISVEDYNEVEKLYNDYTLKFDNKETW